MSDHDWETKYDILDLITVHCAKCGIEKDQYSTNDNYSLWMNNRAVHPKYYKMTCAEIIMEEVLK